MARPRRIEGYAIVSSNGMIADAAGVFPEALKFPADQRLFEQGLNEADVVAHGRHSRERQPGSERRRRIVLTRRIAALGRDPARPLELLWNSDGASFEAAWAELGVADGTLAVIGGTDVFGLFLDAYDLFHLTRAAEVFLPGGRPVFPGVPARPPEAILGRHGMEPGAIATLAPDQGLTVTNWRRSD